MNLKDLSDKAFEGLPPFTLTIDQSNDARLLSWAIVQHYCDGDKDDTVTALKLLFHVVDKHGIDDGVEAWIEGAKVSGRDVPRWLGPMMKHIVTHVRSKLDEIDPET